MFKAPDYFMESMFNDQAINVLVIGAGGTGSAFLSKLAQLQATLTHLGAKGFNVVVADDDTVSQTNIGRQAFYPMDIGANKARTLVERFNNFTGTSWRYVEERITKHSSLIHKAHIVVTCVDNPQSRVDIGESLGSSHSMTTKLWLDGGNDANSGQVILGCYPSVREKTARRLPSVFDLYEDSLRTAEYKESDSCSHEEALTRQEFGVNDQIATQMIQILWQLMRHGEIKYHGVLIDLKAGEHQPLPINPLNWELMGFTELAV